MEDCGEVILLPILGNGTTILQAEVHGANERTSFIADAHRDDGKRFVVRAGEKLTAFVGLERAVCIHLLTDEI
jgi:hypothetical protein